MTSFTVRAPARMHLGLLDMSGATGRRFGGAGFMVTAPQTVVTVRRANRPAIEWDADVSARDRMDLEKLVAGVSATAGRPFSVTVEQHPPMHVGCGTKTTLLLSVLAAVNALADMGWSTLDMQQLSGRGGASGIGVHGFFGGGFLVDVGHPRSADSLRPSSAVTPDSVPLISSRAAMPPEWRILLIRPKVGVVREAGAEESFFRANTPLPAAEALEAIAAVYHGLLPAVLSEDLPTFGYGLRQLQDIGFKRRELLGQPAVVGELLKALREAFPAAGMSSMGPLLFAIDTVDRTEEAVGSLPDASVVASVAPDNNGYTLEPHE